MHILIADDDPISRTLLERTLSRMDHAVQAVADGQAALDVLLRTDPPTMAILDWMMPRVDGLEVCRRLRARADGPYIYIILLTGRTGDSDLIQALDAGADSFLRKPFSQQELNARLESGRRVLALQDHLLEVQEQLRFQATRDHLTGLWNRRMITEQLGREMKRARHERRPISVVLADLDHFKAVNDTFGHSAGDIVLRQAAQRMQAVVREYDFLGRYGGEEFMLVLPGCASGEALRVAERLRKSVSAEPVDMPALANDSPARNVSITASLGVASPSESGDDPDALVECADRALYQAKSEGRDRTVVYNRVAHGG